MAEISFFDRVATHNTHVPDVLSCIANLSNDEVFTPPDVVNKMLDLLPQELFADPKTTFLDPATKTGVFLREIAKRCLDAQLPGYKERSLEITEKKRLDIPLDEYDIAFEKQLQEKIDHIFHNQLFGIGITELTSLLARRSVYCSKYPNGPYSITHFDDAEGNIRFRRTEHTWDTKKLMTLNGKKLGKCIYCGASREMYDRGDSLESHAYEFIHAVKPEEIFNMQFDVIIGNPPYQLNVGIEKENYAIPLYHYFVEQAKKLNPRYLTMIIPSRWFSGGRGLDVFRETMLNDRHIRVLHDFLDASDCFSGVEIKGGVCYFLWDRDNNGDCNIYTHANNSIDNSIRPLLEPNNDTFIRYNAAIPILKKVLSFRETSFSSIVSPQTPFGLYSSFDKFADFGEIKVYANKKIGWLDNNVTLTKNVSWIDSWKLFIPKAIGSGELGKDIVKPIMGEPNSICTQTYLLIGPFENKQICENAITYINTKFFHFMLGLKKVTQDAMSKVYSLIPLQDFSKPWTDEELYKKYGLTEEEIAFIEKTVWPNKMDGEE